MCSYFWLLKKQETNENAGQISNLRDAGQRIQMLCSTTQSGTPGYLSASVSVCVCVYSYMLGFPLQNACLKRALSSFPVSVGGAVEGQRFPVTAPVSPCYFGWEVKKK